MSRIRRITTRLAAACLLLAAVSASVAQTFTLQAVADATIYDDGTAAYQQVADGSGPHLWTSTIAAGVRRRALVRFDLTVIPQGSIVRSVRLSLFQNRARDEHVVSVHRLLSGWNEGSATGGSAGVGSAATAGDVTWVSRSHPGIAWATPGADRVLAASSARSVGVASSLRYEWPSTTAIIADVQSWIDRSAPNHGWVLIGDEVKSMSAKQFSSREGGGAFAGPLLVVEVEPPSGGSPDGEVPLPWWLVGLLALAVGRALRSR